jgi:hypothetical protein
VYRVQKAVELPGYRRRQPITAMRLLEVLDAAYAHDWPDFRMVSSLEYDAMRLVVLFEQDSDEVTGARGPGDAVDEQRQTPDEQNTPRNEAEGQGAGARLRLHRSECSGAPSAVRPTTSSAEMSVTRSSGDSTAS